MSNESEDWECFDNGPGWEWQQQELEQRYYEEMTAHEPGQHTPATATDTTRKYEESNMRISDAFPSKWLKAEDLQGRPVTVTIQNVVMEDMGQGEGPSSKPVVYFVGKEKGLALNKTNASTLAASLGDETGNWLGREIVLMSTKVNYKGRMVDGIRVSVPATAQATPQMAEAAQPQAAPAATPETGDDDIPF